MEEIKIPSSKDMFEERIKKVEKIAKLLNNFILRMGETQLTEEQLLILKHVLKLYL